MTRAIVRIMFASLMETLLRQWQARDVPGSRDLHGALSSPRRLYSISGLWGTQTKKATRDSGVTFLLLPPAVLKRGTFNRRKYPAHLGYGTSVWAAHSQSQLHQLELFSSFHGPTVNQAQTGRLSLVNRVLQMPGRREL